MLSKSREKTNSGKQFWQNDEKHLATGTAHKSTIKMLDESSNSHSNQIVISSVTFLSVGESLHSKPTHLSVFAFAIIRSSKFVSRSSHRIHSVNNISFRFFSIQFEKWSKNCPPLGNGCAQLYSSTWRRHCILKIDNFILNSNLFANKLHSIDVEEPHRQSYIECPIWRPSLSLKLSQ